MNRYCAGIYARLSVKGCEKKAQSIKNQIMICKEYIRVNNDITLSECYSDYGKSGMNFDRPEFKRMYKDIAAGKVNCVIVKDLSRFGRNHIDVGEYIQKIFKESEKHTLDILLKGNLKMRGLALMSFRKKSHLGNIPT